MTLFEVTRLGLFKPFDTYMQPLIKSCVPLLLPLNKMCISAV